MLTLIQPIELNESAIASPNLCDRFDERDLDEIGNVCKTGYLHDEASRHSWLKRNEAGMDLALQVQKDKTFPWPNCSNVAFPLVTIAAMQFHARAYPAIVSGKDVVKGLVVGPDPTGELNARAERVSTHMSWQLLYEDRAWEEQMDKGLLNLSIVGTNFKKSYNDAGKRHNVSDLVLAKDLILNYWAKSVEDCPRKTHRIPLFRNEVRERVMRGTFRDILSEAWYTALPVPQTTQAQQQVAKDKRQGVIPPQPDDATPLIFMEQHVDLDLDDDGYKEPYIITFEENSGCVVRIVTRFNSSDDIERVAGGKNKGKIVRITAIEYFTKYSFIPSPDGGIYDIGFGVFLGPLNESVNSLVNMLLDAGTMLTTAGGFLGRGAKIRGGVYTIAPFEWKRVDSTGDDLRKSIFPLPVNEPSPVLFNLLSLLINYTNRVAGTTDMMVGENPGQNTPAETSRTMVEMGQKIYTAIFKRIWRSMQGELHKLYGLNRRFLNPDKTYPGGVTRDDYMGSPDFVVPVADPNITSDVAKIQQATAVKVAAAETPGYNRDEAERRYLKALGVDSVDKIFPGNAPPPVDPKLQIAQVKEQGAMQRKQMELEARMQEFTVELMEERRLNNATILNLMAKAEEASANAQSESAYAQVALINAELSGVKERNAQLNSEISHLLKASEIRSRHIIATKKEKASASAD